MSKVFCLINGEKIFTDKEDVQWLYGRADREVRFDYISEKARNKNDKLVFTDDKLGNFWLKEFRMESFGLEMDKLSYLKQDVPFWEKKESPKELSSNKYTSRVSKLSRDGEKIGDYTHITLFYIGEQEHLLDVIKEILGSLINEKLEFKVHGEANFGPNKEVPVYTLEMTDKGLEEQIHILYKSMARPDKGFSEIPERISWHISKRTLSVPLSVGDTIIANQFDIKQLGPHDPCFIKELI
jgi:hypothetical protein